MTKVNRADSRRFRIIAVTLYLILVAVFLVQLGTRLISLNGETVVSLAFPVLAVFYGFSSLMYNRSKALPSGPQQRRSVYAAERALQATVLYLAGISLAAGVHLFFVIGGATATPLKQDPEVGHLVAFAVPITIIGGSWAAFFFAWKAVAYRYFRKMHARTMLRLLR